MLLDTPTLSPMQKNTEAGKSWMPLSANLFRLDSTNPKKNTQTLDVYFLLGGQALHQKRNIQGLGIFL